MESSNLGILDVNSSARFAENYFERFEIWCLTKNKAANRQGAHLLNFIGNDAYELVKTSAYPNPRISLSYEVLKGLL